MLSPLPLERLTLRIKDGVGRLPCLGPQVPNEVRETPSGIAGTVGTTTLARSFHHLASTALKVE